MSWNKLDFGINDFTLEDYSYLANRFRKHFPDLDDQSIKKMIYVTITTCSECRESRIGCQCWNDE